MNSPLFIGIAGPSGAGKTTLAEHITQKFPRVAHIKLDNFYKDISLFPMYEQWINREAPENLYWDDFHKALSSLKRGVAAEVPHYNRASGIRDGVDILPPADVVLVEGYLLYFDPRVRDMFDVRLFLHVSTETQYQRKKSRWPEMDDSYFHNVVVPMFDMHGSHGARHAHHVLNGEMHEAHIVTEFEEFITRNPATKHFL